MVVLAFCHFQHILSAARWILHSFHVALPNHTLAEWVSWTLRSDAPDSNFQILTCCLHSQFHIKLNPLIIQQLNCLRWRMRACCSITQPTPTPEPKTKLSAVCAIIILCSLYELKFNTTVKLFGSDVHCTVCAYISTAGKTNLINFSFRVMHLSKFQLFKMPWNAPFPSNGGWSLCLFYANLPEQTTIAWWNSVHYLASCWIAMNVCCKTSHCATGKKQQHERTQQIHDEMHLHREKIRKKIISLTLRIFYANVFVYLMSCEFSSVIN